MVFYYAQTTSLNKAGTYSTMTITDRCLRWCPLLALSLLHLGASGCAANNLAPPALARSAQPSQSAAWQQDTIAACTALVLDYAVFRDQGDVEGYVELFSPDASLTILGPTIRGQEAIRARIGDAVNGQRSRHLMSTIRITPVDENRATGVSYATIYTGPRPDSESVPISVPGFTAIGDYVDEFVRTDAGWRISKRTLEIQFLFGEQ